MLPAVRINSAAVGSVGPYRTLRAVLVAATTAACLSFPAITAAADGRTIILRQASDTAAARGMAERYVVELAPGASVPGAEALDSHGQAVSVALPAASAESTAAALANDPRVVSIERDIFMPFVHHMDVNDPLLPRQWALGAIRWYEAPYVANAGTVTLLDSGIDRNHVELAGQLPDGRPKIASVWSTLTDDANVTDDVGHGTATASIASALTHNGHGIAAVSPGTQVSMIKVGGLRGASLSAAVKGVNRAVAQNARVINLSFGTPHDSRALRNAIHRAVDRGVVVVAAVGNDGCAADGGGNDLNYPAGYAHVIGVAASSRENRIACFSNHGTEVDIAAPGTDVQVAVPHGQRAGTLQSATGYRTAAGTSFSAPIVAAAVASLRARNPGWTPAQVQQALTVSARDIGPPGWDPRAGAGVLDMQRLFAAQPVVADTKEVNDDVPFVGSKPALARPGRSNVRVAGRLHRSNDPADVYRVRLRRGDMLTVTARFARSRRFRVTVWKPGTATVSGSRSHTRRYRGTTAAARAGRATVKYRAPRGGTYYVQLAAGSTSGPYTLRTTRR